jgi:phosphoserine phosphatase
MRLLPFLSGQAIHALVASGAPSEVLDAYTHTLPIGLSSGVAGTVRGGVFTGDLDLNPAVAETKQAIVAEVAERAEIVLAVGDSTADLPLLGVFSKPSDLHERNPLHRASTG